MARLICGGILALLGAIWMLQGLNILGGSPMTGVSFWAWAGLIVLSAGLGLLAVTVRSSRRQP